MPRASLTDEFVSNAEVPPYNKLKLDTGEKARLAIPDENLLWVEYVHTLRAPALDENGQPIPTQTQAGRNGQVRLGWSTTFVGSFKCFGRADEIAKHRIDPDMCPGCAAAARGVRDMEPERRFSLPVIRYATVNKSSTQLRNPPNAEILIWAMGQKMYDKLMGQKREIDEARTELGISPTADISLKLADIVLNCEDGNFQRIVFMSPKPRAVAHEAVRAVVVPLWGDAANRPTDDQLRVAVVKDKERRWAEADVDDCIERWAKADQARTGATAPAAATAGGPVSGEPSADTGLDELLETTPGAPPQSGDPFNDGVAAAAPPPPGPPADDPFADPAPAAAAAAPVAGHPGGTDEFATPEPPAAAPPVAGGAPAAAAPPPAQEDPFADPAPGAPAANGNGAAAVNGADPGAKSFDEIFKEAQAG